MRCRECGLELDARDRLPNGAYQCPECGAIHHTASSSKVSPSPWRRKRRRSFSSFPDVLSERRFGLPLWGWCAIVLALIIALILLLTLGSGKGADETGMPAAQDELAAEATAEPTTQEDASDDTQGMLPEAPAEVAGDAPTTNTGVAQNDFVVSFDWAMSYLHYTSSLTASSTEPGAGGSSIQHYTFEDWFELSLTIAPDSTTVCSAVATARLPEGSTDNVPALAAFVSTLYGLDNSTNPKTARSELEAMIADNSRSYEGTAFSAILSGDAASGFILTVNGKLS